MRKRGLGRTTWTRPGSIAPIEGQDYSPYGVLTPLLVMAVPANAGVREYELRAVQEAGAPARVVQVEVVGRVR